MEAIKVRMQTTLPPYANNLREGWSKIVQNEGYAGLYKGLYPLWARQIPYTMVKFATFESAVSQIYKTLGRPKESYSSLAQTGVSFAGGYIAGIGCAVVSHPADVMVSKLNADRKAGEGAGKALTRIYGNIGFMGLWNGLSVRIFMIGTLTAFQWLIYDSFKVYLGVSVVLPTVLLTRGICADGALSCRRRVGIERLPWTSDRARGNASLLFFGYWRDLPRPHSQAFRGAAVFSRVTRVSTHRHEDEHREHGTVMNLPYERTDIQA